MGTQCEQPCPRHKFGNKCSQECQCLFDDRPENHRYTKRCDAANGTCYCYDSYIGDNCEVVPGSQSSSLDSSTYSILGGAVAGGVFIFVVVLVSIYCVCKRRKKGQEIVMRAKMHGMNNERYVSICAENSEVTYATVGDLSTIEHPVEVVRANSK